ncbi:hypothetical protein QCA50_020454 [Cerrena zonata]
MTRNPTFRSVRLDVLADDYGAIDIVNALSTFIVKWNCPGVSRRRLQHEAANVLIRFHSLPVYHTVRFANRDLSDKLNNDIYRDMAHAKPATTDRHGRAVPARFDTVLVDCRRDTDTQFSGVQGFRVGRVRTVFTLSERICDQVLDDDVPLPGYLAYIDWFTPFQRSPHRDHGMYRVTREYENGVQYSSIIPVEQIVRSVMLFPQFGPVVDREWTSDNVLDLCDSFYVNPFVDEHSYRIIF